jgi:hypothetical protein
MRGGPEGPPGKLQPALAGSQGNQEGIHAMYAVPTSTATAIPSALTALLITSERRMRVTFLCAPAGPVAKAIRSALERTYQDVRFEIRHRSAKTHLASSWVECTWSGGPNERETAAVVGVVFRRLAGC